MSIVQEPFAQSSRAFDAEATTPQTLPQNDFPLLAAPKEAASYRKAEIGSDTPDLRFVGQSSLSPTAAPQALADPARDPRTFRDRLSDTYEMYLGQHGIAREWYELLTKQAGAVGGIAAGIGVIAHFGFAALPVAAGIAVGSSVYLLASQASSWTDKLIWGNA